MADVPQMTLASRTVAPRGMLAANAVLLSTDTALRFPRFNVVVGQGPVLTTSPANATGVYTATDGGKWFVPRAQLARRSGTSRVPDIRFDKRPDGAALVLVIDLLRDAAISADATPMPLTDLGLQLVGGPTLTWQIEDQPPPAGVVRRLRVQAALDDAGVNALVALMQTRADGWFKLDANVQFQISTPGDPHQTPPIIVRPPIDRAMLVNPASQRFLVRALDPGTQAIRATAPALTAVRLNPAPVPAAPPVISQHVARLQLSTPQSVPAAFPPSVRINQIIYAEVAGGAGADIDSHWVTDANVGDLKEAPRFNQYYILPDSFGLALDADHTMPGISALLIPGPDPSTQGTAAFRVRVRFAIAPHIEPKRAAAIREQLRQREGLAFADLAIGGYRSASFEASNLLTQLGATPGSVPAAKASVEVDPRNGFDITLDLTVEQYALLTTQLTASSGSLRGRVRFVLDSDDTATLQRDVDVVLRLDRPVETALVMDTAASNTAGAPPDRVTVRNPSQLPVTVGAVNASLLVMDEGVPLESRPAAAAPGGFTLAAGGSIDLAVTLANDVDGPFVWNALSLSLDQVSVPFQPKDVLARVHELAASTRVPGRMRVWSWPLQQTGRLPPDLEGKLFGLDVEIRRRAEDSPVTVTLTVGEADKEVDFGFTLADLAAGAAPGQSAFQMRRRNKLIAGLGAWSEWTAQTGRELHCDLVPMG